MPLGDGVDPDAVLVNLRYALKPDATRLLIPVFHRPARIGDFIGGHGGVADKDDLVVGGIFVKYVPGVHLLCVAATIVLPHAFIKAVMKVEIFEILELGT